MINIISERSTPRITFKDMPYGETFLRDNTYFIKIPKVKAFNEEIHNAVALNGSTRGMLYNIPLDEAVQAADLKAEAYL